MFHGHQLPLSPTRDFGIPPQRLVHLDMLLHPDMLFRDCMQQIIPKLELTIWWKDKSITSLVYVSLRRARFVGYQCGYLTGVDGAQPCIGGSGPGRAKVSG